MPLPLPSESRAARHRVRPKVHSVGNSEWVGGKGGGEAPDIPIVHIELVFLGWRGISLGDGP